MAGRRFAIGCLHLFHENMTKWKDGRPEFKDAREMNECLLDNWNSVVKPGDKVYVLGDVVIKEKEEFLKLWPKFNGSKRLVVGNHDDIRFLSSGGLFKNVYMWRKIKEDGAILTHVPLHESSLDGLVNLHAHTHRHGSPLGPYFSVTPELNNYKPVELEYAISEALSRQHKRLQEVPLDHQGPDQQKHLKL
jgi:calcineurin-like phosphoesterase family protein